ncbi:MAG TPA: polyketide synthase [Legionella sp.]|nr:polyketide synthase [Legionella sp.]
MNDDRIAIIGMGCRFPGAKNSEEYWANLCAGTHSVTTLSEETLREAGVPEHLLQDSRYVKQVGLMEGTENFDAAFFGYSPLEAKMIDPQQRVFLEVAWTALEDAGYIPQQFKSPVGVFAGSAPNKYFLYHLFGRNPSEVGGYDWEIDDFPVGVNADALSARLSYKLGLTGPSVSVQTACSTSLVAVALACDSLLNFNCDLALAGGVAILLPSQSGYLYQEGGMLSKSGTCRSFDATADGSVFGSGAGVVVLKRLQDALDDNDHIHGVIRGWAVRNDGANRAGYTAPGVEGQANVVVEAQVAAGVRPEDISYIETHGSATPVGDPIEIASLTRAFSRAPTDLRGTCSIGSVKSNVGHLDAAAGIAGLIKTTLALKNRILPKTLHFEKANPAIDFDNSPFIVQNETLNPWISTKPLIAGVSSFGLGGTNAHIILEEPPVRTESSVMDVGEISILPLSTMTPHALDKLTTQILDVVKSYQTNVPIQDAAYTLALGRTAFQHRAALVVSADKTQIKIIKNKIANNKQGVTFLFPGVGDQFPGSFRALYEQDGVFGKEIRRVAQEFKKHIDIDLIDYLYPTKASKDTTPQPVADEDGINFLRMLGRNDTQADVNMQGTTVAQPACFAIEYALARQLISWGIIPKALLGHSIGEFVAACVSGALSFDDAVALVAVRATAIEKLPSGSMLAIPLSQEELTPLLLDGVWISAVNAQNLTVVSGTHEAIDVFQRRLAADGHVCQKLRTTHPFHSELLRQAADILVDRARDVTMHVPKIPYISNVTGTWITAEQLNSPEYWGEHLCKPVQFEAGVNTICGIENLGICIEVGPGQTLENYTRQIARKRRPELNVFRTGASYFESKSAAQAILMETIANAWVHGVPVNWKAFYQEKKRNRIPMPTYPFDSKRYWIERDMQPTSVSVSALHHVDSSGFQMDAFVPVDLNLSSGEPRPEMDTPYVAATNEIEHKLVELWKSLFGYADIGVHDDFVSLGGHSLLALQFANKLWREHQVEVAISALLDHSTIASLALHLEPVFITRLISTNGQDIELKPTLSVDNKEVTSAILEQYITDHFTRSLNRSVLLDSALTANDVLHTLPELIRALRRDFDFKLYPNEVSAYRSALEFVAYLTTELSQYNPAVCDQNETDTFIDPRPIVFILSAVRSGSTLLRVMLAGHPQLFCPPEFHLLAYSSMQEREASDRAPDKNQGIESALVEAFGIDRSEAAEYVLKMTLENRSPTEFVSQIAAAVPDRLLIDKSPGNANNIQTLQRIKTAFPNAKFICLFRHPYSVIDSVVKNRFVKLMGGGATNPFDFGEFIWSRSNGNILDFVETLDSSDVLQIKYENLVTQPAAIARTLCDFLQVPFTDAILAPYSGRRMRDGLGDPNFLDHDGIDARLANAWKTVKLPRSLNRSCRLIARSLDYEIE